MKRRSPAVVGLIGVVILALLSLFSVAVGAAPIGVAKLLGILATSAGLPTSVPHAPWEATLVIDVRLPRIVTGALVGALLSASGTALQALFRNPLADPGVLGVASGASFGAVLAIALGLGAASAWSVPAMAVIGAALTALTVYGISARGGRIPVGTLLLAGIAVGSLASALTSLVLSLSLEEYEQGRQAFRWLMGGLEARTWGDVLLVLPAAVAGTGFILAAARELDALLVGEVDAVALGVDVPRLRVRLIAVTSVMVGAAVAVSGVLGFVGLVVPHVARLLVGPSHGRLIPVSVILGATFVVGADLLCRTVAPPEEIRLGVMTACVGAPFFLFLLLSRRKDLPTG